MTTEPVSEKPRRSHTPRLRDLQYESIHVRLPRGQVQALVDLAAAEFRSLPEQIAYLVAHFLFEREGQP